MGEYVVIGCEIWTIYKREIQRKLLKMQQRIGKIKESSFFYGRLEKDVKFCYILLRRSVPIGDVKFAN